MEKAKQRYSEQRSSAIRRNIPFLLTFEEWCAIWNQSGKWEQRGTKTDQYCMSRYNDTGPYCVDNVEIKTCYRNHSEGNNVGKIPTQKVIEQSRLNGLKTKGQTAWNKGMKTGSHSEESNKKRAETLKGKAPPNKGIPWSEERRAAGNKRKAKG